MNPTQDQFDLVKKWGLHPPVDALNDHDNMEDFLMDELWYPDEQVETMQTCGVNITQDQAIATTRSLTSISKGWQDSDDAWKRFENHFSKLFPE